MPPRIPGPKPTGKVDLLALLGEHLFNAIIAKPLGFLLSIFLPGDPEDWDTLDEIQDGFESWLDGIPILGDLDNIIDAIRAAVTGGTLPSGNPLSGLFADVLGLRTQTVTNTAAIALLSEVAAPSWVTPAYVGGLQDMVTVPRVDLRALSISSVGTHTHGISGVSATAGAGDLAHNHGVGTYSAAAGGGHTHATTVVMPQFWPEVQDLVANSGKTYYTPIPVDRPGRLKKLRWITGSDTSLWGIDQYIVGLMVYNPATENAGPGTGFLEKVWDSGDIKGGVANVNATKEVYIDMGLDEAEGSITPGQLLFCAIREANDTLGQGSRPVGALLLPDVEQPDDKAPLDATCWVSGNQTAIPSSVRLSTLTKLNTILPWFALSVDPPTA